VGLRLRKYVSLWRTNLCAKRVEAEKRNKNVLKKMKSKLKGRFLPASYLQDSYALHKFTQRNMIVEEYTREFKKLLIKYHIQEPKEQTIVRYFRGLDPK